MPSCHFRMTEAQHAELSREAAAAGRSLQRELEWRVFRHYEVTRAFDPTGGGLAAGDQPEVQDERPTRTAPGALQGETEATSRPPRSPGPPAPAASPSPSARSAAISEEPPASKTKGRARTTMCEHRVPAGTFCKRCD